MLKILPIFIIFFLTGLFLLKVDNLTQRKNKSLSENYDIEANLNSNNQEEVINNSIENYGKQDKLTSSVIEKENKDKNTVKINSFDAKMQEEEKQKDLIYNKKFSVQFGAFSKEVGAKKLKNKVDRIIKPKFDFFESKIQFNEQKKIYFLKFDSDSKENVYQTCKFSKSKEIDCYVIQR